MSTSPEWADHVSTVALRANDFDFLGHLNNSVHAQLMETGRWEWALSNGVDLRTAPIAAVVVSLHIDYLKSIPWDPMGRVLVRTGLAESKKVTFTVRQTIEMLDGVLAARGTVRLAPVDRATGRPCRAGLGSLRAD
jgi:acyl-CoA thioesterase FadM